MRFFQHILFPQFQVFTNLFGFKPGGPGSFLVRPSDNSPGDYSLFFHINNQIQRFRIEKKGVRYVMGGRTFDALEAVINRYKTEQIVEGHSLGHHIRRVRNKFKTPAILGAQIDFFSDWIIAIFNVCNEPFENQMGFVLLQKCRGSVKANIFMNVICRHIYKINRSIHNYSIY